MSVETIELLQTIGSAPLEHSRFVENHFINARYCDNSVPCRNNSGIITKIPDKGRAFGVSSRNREQAFALNALLDPSITLVTLTGKAGCGKSLLALAAAAELVFEKQLYEKITIIRPTTSLGQGIGFLPGTIDEKLAPWTVPIVDTLNYVFSSKERSKDRQRVDKRRKSNIRNDILSSFISDGRIEMDAMAFIRGRSIHKSYIIVDEAQNMTRHEIKTIVTRAGEGSKVAVTGDIHQIDVPSLTSKTCGISMLASAFKNESLAAHVELRVGERSKLASLCAELL